MLRHLTVFASLSLTLASSAWADDGGVVGISVNELSMVKTTWSQATGNQEIKIKKPSYRIDLSGKEADKLLAILPSREYVITGMYPAFAATYNANFKSLAVTASQQQPMVMIDCNGGDLKEYADKAPTFTKYKDGAKCSITVSDFDPDGNVSYTFDPAKAICHK